MISKFIHMPEFGEEGVSSSIGGSGTSTIILYDVLKWLWFPLKKKVKSFRKYMYVYWFLYFSNTILSALHHNMLLFYVISTSN